LITAAAVRDFDLTLGPVGIEEDEQVGGFNSLILAVVGSSLPARWIG
jgi:hypothetical protein